MEPERKDNDASSDSLGAKLVEGAARALHRLGLKGAARRLRAMEMQRWLVSRHSGADDDADNARTTPPDNERVEFHSVWMVEVFPPSSSVTLGGALRRLPSGGIYRDQDLGDDVARARRYPLGGSWWNLGVFYNRLHGAVRVGGAAVELPPQVDHLLLSLYAITPSLACAVGQFVLTDAAGSSLDSIVRTHYTTRAERKPHGAVGVRRPAEIKRDLVAEELDRVHDDCRSWFQDNLPGAFSQGLLDGRVPTCCFLTLKEIRPLSEESRLGYIEPLGIDMSSMALTSDDLPGLRLSESTGVHRTAHTFLLAGKTDEIFPGNNDLGGHGRGRDGFTVALWMRLNRFMAIWGLERTLLGYEMAFGRLRDSFAAARPASIRENLSSLAVASENVAKLSGDAQAVASDAGRLAEDRHLFEKELPIFEPVEPELWRLEGTWTEMLRDSIEVSARRVRENEAVARDLEVTRASIISSRTNLSLQVSLRRLTVFLVILTIVLVIIGAATLDAMK
jgi:hypothetical protein